MLSWNANIEPDVAGYHVLVGTVSGNPTVILDVGLQTSVVISALLPGTTYYFSVTAYTAAGQESLPSAEVSYTTSGIAPSPTPAPTPPPPTPSATPTPPPANPPVLNVFSANVNVGTVEQVTLNNGLQNVNDIIALVPAGGTAPVDWYYMNGTKVPPSSGIASATLAFPMTSAGQFEFRYCTGSQVWTTSDQIKVTLAAHATPTPNPVALNKNLSNVSTRAKVQTGDNVVIGGFIISGTVPKKVIIRALGPSLVAAGLPNALREPTLTLYNSGGTAIAWNDHWRNSPDAVSIQSFGLAPSSDSESALMMTLGPGVYTTKVEGTGGSVGIALVEVYDTDSKGSRITNISTRGRVETDDNVMIGGFIINGSQSTSVLIRALGPSLAKSGVTGTLSDPTLEIYNSSGVRIASNDNWKKTQKSQITATKLAPTDDRESAILTTLAPGTYTAIVRGVSSTTGVALVEVYSL